MCSPDAPDYGPMAEASEESARIMADLGYAQMEQAQANYNRVLPMIDAITQSQVETMNQTAGQGADYYNYMKDTFRPVEQSIVRDAMDFNTEAERERIATEAAGDLEQQFAIQEEGEARRMASMGVNPSSGRAAASRRQGSLKKAAMRADTMNKARTTARNMGYARKLDVAGMGRGLPGASAAAYGVSTNAGNSASGNAQSPGANLMNGMGMGANTVGQGQNMRMQGQQTILNSQTSLAGQDSGLGSAIGGIGSAIGYFSSKKLKKKTGEVDAEQVSKDVEKMPVDRWKYKDGEGDGGEHIGAYAEDMKKLGASDGNAVDVISVIGVNTAAVKGVSKRLSKLEEQIKKGKANG